MKYRIALILIILTFLSCGTESGSNAEDYIKIPESINFFSNDFKEAKKIAFKRTNEEVIELNVNTEYKIIHAGHGDRKRYLENLDITLYHTTFPHYAIHFQGTGLFNQSSYVVAPFLGIHFMSSDNNYTMVSSLNIGNPDYLPGPIKFHPEIVLTGSIFQNVYSLTNEDKDAFTEVYFSQEVGLVAFRDEHNQLWVYDKIIE